MLKDSVKTGDSYSHLMIYPLGRGTCDASADAWGTAVSFLLPEASQSVQSILQGASGEPSFQGSEVEAACSYMGWHWCSVSFLPNSLRQHNHYLSKLVCGPGLTAWMGAGKVTLWKSVGQYHSRSLSDSVIHLIVTFFFFSILLVCLSRVCVCGGGGVHACSCTSHSACVEVGRQLAQVSFLLPCECQGLSGLAAHVFSCCAIPLAPSCICFWRHHVPLRICNGSFPLPRVRFLWTLKKYSLVRKLFKSHFLLV